MTYLHYFQIILKYAMNGVDELPSTNICPTPQTHSSPGIVTSTPVKESPRLDGAVEALRAQHQGVAGQAIGGHPPSCSQTPSFPQACQVPWQLCSADHVSCWAAYQRLVARREGGQLIPGVDYRRVEEDWGKLETQSESEYDSDPAINESIKAWMKKTHSDDDDSDDDCTF